MAPLSIESGSMFTIKTIFIETSSSQLGPGQGTRTKQETHETQTREDRKGEHPHSKVQNTQKAFRYSSCAVT